MDIHTLITARFLVVANSGPVWRVSAPALPTLSRNAIAINAEGEFAPPDDWREARNLRNFEALIARNSETFRNRLEEIVEQHEATIDKCAGYIRQPEFAILLAFGGSGVYDFFVRDHRFGTPPRGKQFRSNLRGPWIKKVGHRKIHRPDNAVLAANRSINRFQSTGADVSSLIQERDRRAQMIREGLDWRENGGRIIRGGALKDPTAKGSRPGRKIVIDMLAQEAAAKELGRRATEVEIKDPVKLAEQMSLLMESGEDDKGVTE